VGSTLPLEPWHQHVRLDNSTLLILLKSGKLALLEVVSDTSGEVIIDHSDRLPKFAEEVYALAAFQEADEFPHQVFLLSDEAVQLWRLGENAFDTIGLPPEEDAGPAADMSVTVDAGGIWLATRGHGLWRHYFSDNDGEGPWTTYDERDDLPSSFIEAIISRDKNRAVIFTQAGPVTGEKTGREWRFVRPSSVQGISTGEVRDGVLFELGIARAVALATDNGVTIARWSPGATSTDEPQQWTQLNRDTGLLDNDVWTLQWDNAGQRLWVGSKSEVTAVKLEAENNGTVQARERESVTTADGLQISGGVIAISVDRGGNEAWILTNGDDFNLYRWRRGEEQVIAADSFILANVEEAKLGPAVDDSPPQVLLRDRDGDWSVWDLASFIRPKLEAPDEFWRFRSRLELESLDPRLEEIDGWEVTYAHDRVDGSWSERGWGPPIDLWGPSENNSLIARLKSKHEPTVEYRTVTEISSIQTSTTRVARLVFLGLALLLPLITAAWELRRRFVRARRLRGREMPYVVGEVILEPTQFFGRQELLQELRNAIATAIYALVADFRTGKTSIQHQLTDILESAKDPNYVFLPVFIDLQRFPGGDDAFFHFLGAHLVSLAQKYKVPLDVIEDLEHQTVVSEAEYDVQSFEDDLEALLEHWNAHWSPRKPIVVLQIDEIGLFENLTYGTLLQLRSVFIIQPQIKTVMTGVEIPKREEVKTSQWWNFLRQRKLESLTPDEARKLIVEPARGLFVFENQAVEDIMIEGQRQPFRLQKLCADLLKYKYSRPRLTRTITLEDFRASIKRNEDRES
jgi:hypothetical protein